MQGRAVPVISQPVEQRVTCRMKSCKMSGLFVRFLGFNNARSLVAYDLVSCVRNKVSPYKDFDHHDPTKLICSASIICEGTCLGQQLREYLPRCPITLKVHGTGFADARHMRI